jgi:hypothetical protein
MSWAKLIIVLLSFLMMAQDNNTQAQEENAQMGSQVLYEVMQTMGKEIIDGQHRGGGIGIPNPELNPCTARNGYCEYATSIYRGALKAETEVKLRVTKNIQTSYKGRVAIGNETSVELSFSALSLDSSVPVMTIFSPTFKGTYEANIRYVSAEVTIAFDNKVKTSYLRDYGLGDPIFIYAANISLPARQLGITQAEIVRISVLPVTLTEFLNKGGE